MKISDFSRIPFVMKFIRQHEAHVAKRDIFFSFTFINSIDAWAVEKHKLDEIRFLRHEYSLCLGAEQFRIMVNPHRSKVSIQVAYSDREISRLRLVAYRDPETQTVMDTGIMPSARERIAQDEFWEKCEWCTNESNQKNIDEMFEKGIIRYKWGIPRFASCPNRLQRSIFS